jgi:hypothetical protein
LRVRFTEGLGFRSVWTWGIGYTKVGVDR